MHAFANHGLQLGSLAPQLAVLALFVGAIAALRMSRLACVLALALAVHGFLQTAGPAHVHAQLSASHGHAHVEHHQHANASDVIEVQQATANDKPGFDVVVQASVSLAVQVAGCVVISEATTKIPVPSLGTPERPPAPLA